MSAQCYGKSTVVLLVSVHHNLYRLRPQYWIEMNQITARRGLSAGVSSYEGQKGRLQQCHRNEPNVTRVLFHPDKILDRSIYIYIYINEQQALHSRLSPHIKCKIKSANNKQTRSERVSECAPSRSVSSSSRLVSFIPVALTDKGTTSEPHERTKCSTENGALARKDPHNKLITVSMSRMRREQQQYKTNTKHLTKTYNWNILQRRE